MLCTMETTTDQRKRDFATCCTTNDDSLTLPLLVTDDIHDAQKRPRLSMVNHVDLGTASVSMDNYNGNKEAAQDHTVWTHFRDTEAIKKDTTCVLSCHADLPQQVRSVGNALEQDDEEDSSTQTAQLDSNIDQAHAMRRSPTMEHDNSISLHNKDSNNNNNNRIVEELASKLDCWSITNLKEWRKQQIIESASSSCTNRTMSTTTLQREQSNRNTPTSTPQLELSPRSVMRQRQQNARKEMIRLMTKVTTPITP